MQTPLNGVVRAHLKAGRLVPVLGHHSAPPLPLAALYPRNRHLSPKVRAFVDWVVGLYARELAV
jgi:LysR family transcriptional regulator, regulator for bpeEF and oprC